MRIIDERAAGCTKVEHQKEPGPGGVPGTFLANEHAVAIAIEAVSGFHRMPVRPQNIFTPGKGGYEREQTRTRQVKIGQQLIYHSERLTRVDKNAGFRAPRGGHVRFPDIFLC